jgi:uncharacterized LabA/DUF88 family protein
MAKTACYVDGFNLYHAIDALEVPHIKWLNLKALAETFLRPGDELDRVVYFTAEMVWDREKLRRHREYLAALKAVGVEPVIAKFLRTEKHCSRMDRYCSFTEEKRTDVGFSARVLSDVMTQQIARVILITADSDQVPTVAAVRGLAPNVSVLVACPPERYEIAKELRLVAHDEREIHRGRLERCLFPRNVLNAKGSVVARCPAKYNHPEAAA